MSTKPPQTPYFSRSTLPSRRSSYQTYIPHQHPPYHYYDHHNSFTPPAPAANGAANAAPTGKERKFPLPGSPWRSTPIPNRPTEKRVRFQLPPSREELMSSSSSYYSSSSSSCSSSSSSGDDDDSDNRSRRKTHHSRREARFRTAETTPTPTRSMTPQLRSGGWGQEGRSRSEREIAENVYRPARASTWNHRGGPSSLASPSPCASSVLARDKVVRAPFRSLED